MTQSWSAQVGARTDPGQAHLAHIALHPFAIDNPLRPQQRRDFARTVEGMGGIEFINPVFDSNLLG
jgi:hypothetical protein